MGVEDIRCKKFVPGTSIDKTSILVDKDKIPLLLIQNTSVSFHLCLGKGK